MSAADPVVIASYARTPMGGFQGALSPVKATDLGAAAVKSTRRSTLTLGCGRSAAMKNEGNMPSSRKQAARASSGWPFTRIQHLRTGSASPPNGVARDAQR